jgi:hypothetical protein
MDKKKTSHFRNSRRSIRRPTRQTTKVICFGGKLGLGPNIANQILDISETGARLRVKEECVKNQELELHLSGLSHRRPVRMRGEVVWCVRTNEGDYCVGVQFRGCLPFKDVQLL